MSGGPLHHQARLFGLLLGRLDRGVERLAVAAAHASAFRQTDLGVDVVPMLVDQVFDAGSGGGFLAGLRDKDHVAIERDMETLQHHHRHEVGQQIALVVQRAAAVDIAALAGGAEGREDPFGSIDPDRVAVAHDQQRPLGSVAFQPGNQVGAGRVLGDKHRGDAFRVQNLLDVLGDFGFIAGRVGAVDAHQSLEVAHGLFVDLRPVGSLGKSGQGGPKRE